MRARARKILRSPCKDYYSVSGSQAGIRALGKRHRRFSKGRRKAQTSFARAGHMNSRNPRKSGLRSTDSSPRCTDWCWRRHLPDPRIPFLATTERPSPASEARPNSNSSAAYRKLNPNHCGVVTSRRSVPAPSAVEAAAAKNEQDDKNDQKCRGIHDSLLGEIEPSSLARLNFLRLSTERRLRGSVPRPGREP